jgi:C4-dicarboxylate transporter, DctQ subunit
MKKFLEVLDKAQDGMAFLAGLSLIFIMLAVCADVLLRTFLKMPQVWVTEVIESLLLYITFLGSAWLLRKEGHVQVDIIISRLNPKAIAFLNIISSIIGVFISLMLTIFGSIVALNYYHRGIYTPTAMEIPVYIILVIIPIGSIFLLAQFIRQTVMNIVKFLTGSNGNEDEA